MWKDELETEIIDPTFYAMLKEEGLPTARYADGTYKDTDTQKLWAQWKEKNNG